MTRGWGLQVVLSLLFVALVLATAPALAAHKPIYKWSVDVLEPGEWDAHFVWLRSPHFNYLGKVYWEFEVEASGAVDVSFLDWTSFRRFQSGEAYQPLVPPLQSASAGAQGTEGLTGDLPYFLLLENPGDAPVTVSWTVYAEIDWRRWQQGEPGPVLDLVFVAGSPLLARGESWEMTFSEPGFYHYYCDPHADMTALVEVLPADTQGPTVEVAIHEFGFHRETLRISQGTTVRWTNDDGVAHSVQVELIPDGIPEPAPSGSLRDSLLPWWPVALVLIASTVLLLIRWRRPRA